MFSVLYNLVCGYGNKDVFFASVGGLVLYSVYIYKILFHHLMAIALLLSKLLPLLDNS